MTENLLDAGLSGATGGGADAPAVVAGDRPGRPAGLPDKFWDDRSGQVRLDALIKSYVELERKLGSQPVRDVPAAPDQYRLVVKNDLLTADADINKRLHAAGFSQEQAQLVYDLACERLMPMISELAAMFEADAQIERLTQHFGGPERWREVARQIDAWGRARLPGRVFEALSTTFEGVVAMHRMLEGEEPGLLRSSGSSDPAADEAQLKQLMRDPRYWKHQDPAMVDKVREGFRRLYQDKN
ncbi:MAG: hypothetical protein U1E33_03325 [Rhodospirillales bacterium]